MEFIKKHIDTVVILSAFSASILWMNTQFNQVDNRFGKIDQELAVIKTVLIMKKIMPTDLALKDVSSTGKIAE